MAPLISVIIPVYNTDQYLADCLKSVCEQTLQDIEIICVDDGSTDNCPLILKAFSSRDDRIRVITQKNSGRTAARNKGIQEATGQWIGFVDSDDSVDPDYYQHLLKNAENNCADISHSGLLFCYSDGHKVPHFGTGSMKLQNHDTGLLDLLEGSQIEPSMCCKLYRRDLFKNFFIAPEMEVNEDLFGNFILFDKASTAVYEDFCGYHYRQRHGSYHDPETLMEILSVRHKLIMISETPLICNAAYRLWLSTLVNTLNKLSVNTENEITVFYNRCHKLLVSERNNIGMLSKKQQIAAILHLNFPKAAKMIYKIYGRYAKYRYEH